MGFSKIKFAGKSIPILRYLIGKNFNPSFMGIPTVKKLFSSSELLDRESLQTKPNPA